MRSRLAWLAPLALLTLSGPASADIDAARVTRALRAASSKAVVRHPLAENDGRIPLLVRLPAGVRAADRGLLEVAPGFGAIRLDSAALDAFVARNPDLHPVASPPRHTMINSAAAWDGASQFRQDKAVDGTGVVIGIVDTGIDAAHRDFIGANNGTRIAWLLNRQEPAGLHPDLEERYGCTDPNQSPCAIFAGPDINSLLVFNIDGAPRDYDGHGTHVASLAAGNGGVTLNESGYAGIAPGATLIITSPSGGGGFSDPDIIRAVQFIFEQAEELGMPAVVNVSLGSDFGPHDGTSALEQGLAALIGPPGRVLVVAAGNSGTTYPLEDQGPFGIHTEAHVSPNAVTRVTIQQPGAKGTVEGSGFIWVNMRPDDEVSVGLEGPDGVEWIGLVAPGDDAGYDDDKINAGVINNVVDDRSELTPETNGAVVFWDGSWDGSTAKFAVLLRGSGDAQLWVTGLGGAGPGGESIGLSFERALKTGTVSVPASHRDLIAVGCTLNRVQWTPFGTNGQLVLDAFGEQSPPIVDTVCYFSGAGPTPDGGMKPDLLAPGGFVAGAMSRDADPRSNPNSIFASSSCPEPNMPCYLVDDRHALTSGTSMSAPQVAGAAALLLQMDPSLTQHGVLELLQAGARRPTGIIDFEYQGGPGALSLIGVLSALDDKAEGKLEPDPIKSWYVLSSPYLRPDPDWRVAGTVELKRSDTGVAHGVAANRIDVRVSGGIVAEQPVQIRGGLYRFSVAARRGSGGTTAEVEVLVDGQSLGKRVLPVGVDAWAALGGVKAVGACTAAPRREKQDGAWWLVLALALWRLRAGRARGNTTA